MSAREYSYNPPMSLLRRSNARKGDQNRDSPSTYRLANGYITDTFRMKAAMKNDFLIDREMQRERNFTGIAGTRHQDMAMSQSMGTISQRTCEHLGTSDKAIITAHRRMVQIAKDLQEGIEPYAATHGDLYRVRSIDYTVLEANFLELLAAHGELAQVQV